MSTGTMDPEPPLTGAERGLDVERDSDVPISTQIYWQLAYQIESGRLQPGVRLAPVRELGADSKPADAPLGERLMAAAWWTVADQRSPGVRRTGHERSRALPW